MLVAAFTSYCAWQFAGTPSTDLMASWLAGHYFALGQFDQIYPHDTTVFTMLPPPAWWPDLQAKGFEGAIFPFIYPPLWAAIAAKLQAVMSFEVAQIIANNLNPLLMGLMVMLAGSMSRGRMPLACFTALGLLLLLFILPGSVALAQNQPQILVAFLIVLAFEREQHKSPILAGCALALAASIKLYPLLFALIWLAGKRYRAAASFAAAGLVLGLLSISMAGWPLHATYLAQVAVIKNSVMINNFTYALDPLIINLALHDAMTFIPAIDNPNPENLRFGWHVLAKPGWAIALSTGVMALTLAVLAYRFSTTRGVSPLFCASAVVTLALVSPLSWGYHYLPALAFLPAIVAHRGWKRGTIIYAVTLIPITPFALGLLLPLTPSALLPQVAGTLSMILLAVAFARTRSHCLKARDARRAQKSARHAAKKQRIAKKKQQAARKAAQQGLHPTPASI
ncbi:DUF2029 domain-containing protein [Alphaproteobacteria bacterium KMM 3653]|uniref:DUF2029 domain-containing protein n=1 Tax=Harenicola maris TaxID=2841044 RepID=A0AAP2G958_9RHOB|nr:DUF2029 domain-containing protein [Harenicola maris]